MTLVRDPRRLLVLAVIVTLVGATAFGLWHLVVGGLVNGNPRAGTFGLVMAGVAGSMLAAVVIGTRRLRRA